MRDWFIKTDHPAAYTVYWFACGKPGFILLFSKPMKSHPPQILSHIKGMNEI